MLRARRQNVTSPRTKKNRQMERAARRCGDLAVVRLTGAQMEKRRRPETVASAAGGTPVEDVEAEGRTVGEATEKALSLLNLRRDQVEVIVLTEGRPRLLGFGGEPARVRVSPIVQVEAEEEEEEEEEEEDYEDEDEEEYEEEEEE